MSIQNARLDLAHQFVEYTSKNVFLTGKAGTGKTTFLKNLRNKSAKRIAVVAPTGVAAINAGGVTMHSMFQLPFGPFIPSQGDSKHLFNFNKEKIRTIQGLDLLVIDEISMVRADLLDALDTVLRRYRNRFKPFGGLQLLMIGDLHQLAPVIKDDEWEMLRDHYASMYFFDSHALKQSDFVTIELTHIYRQSDERFINLLNKVRDKALEAEDIAVLNERYRPHFDIVTNKGYIHLTTHNYSAQAINKSRLDKLSGTSYFFQAKVEGEFPESAYPNEYDLELKIGAQVMFTRNDKDRMYFNGKLGVITDINKEEGLIKVKSEEDSSDITVSKSTWENIKYTLNEDKQVDEKVIGTFIQYPIKTAWAITIHKSQGLTFERAIIDAQASFAHGQVYVALSRCKTLEGLVLSTPINIHSIKSDQTITSFHEVAKQYELNDDALVKAKRISQIEWIKDIFESSPLSRPIKRLQNSIEENHTKLHKDALSKMTELLKGYFTDIEDVFQKFSRQLPSYFENDQLPEENAGLQDRFKKAAVYFIEKLKAIKVTLNELDLESDNKELRKALDDQRQNIQRNIFEKLRIMESLQTHGFNPLHYLQAKANARIDFENVTKEKKAKPAKTSKALIYESTGDTNDLYTMIKEWRDAEAGRQGVNRYQVLPQKTIQELADKLPADIEALDFIHGLGRVRIEQYGNILLKIIHEYSKANNLESPTKKMIETETKPSLKKGETQHASYELFKEGLFIPEIARSRQLTISTIEGHMLEFIKNGAVDIRKLMPEEKIAALQLYMMNNSNKKLKEIKDELGEKYSYSELRMVLASLGL